CARGGSNYWYFDVW
nr:immunoglobulin heavy chain junction region [Mus musculus]MBK4198127.1 immunoglobulin heavy chain junction region [Mus musculus]MBK4198128.1 immunoglobulin heavy chain junction region [Mus musculus]MBK4198129.1 immunoglobulin heavy chain junction region [Mus musculus]MBK4198130.1 immunoglobulin heavy chain junction region [Mus musculus]